MARKHTGPAAEAALAEALHILPAASSTGRGWRGLDACLWQGKPGEYSVDALPDVWLILHASGSSLLASGGQGKRRATPGLVTVIPAGMATRWVIQPDQDAMTAHLSSSALDGLLEREKGSAHELERLPLRFAVADPLIAASLESLLEELRHPREAGSLYADRLADVLLLHLLRSVGGRVPEPDGKGLSADVLRRIRELLDASAERGISLEALAREAGMSRFHFARAFRRSTTVSPHQYLIGVRIERAKQMLRHSELPIVDVALAAGFGSQSHFAHAFRRATGSTPGPFRRRG